MSSFTRWRDEVINTAAQLDACEGMTDEQVLRSLHREVVHLRAENRSLHERTRNLTVLGVVLTAGLIGLAWRLYG